MGYIMQDDGTFRKDRPKKTYPKLKVRNKMKKHSRKINRRK